MKKYRAEIDGLRAFAVILATGFQFFRETFPNGYLGVDMFAVISGYVITSSLSSRKEKNIYQSYYILHKQGRYYIVHFKELFALDGKHANLTQNDVQRRNRIIQLLSDWGLITILNVNKITDIAPLNQIKVLAYKEKHEWILETKYNIGKKKKPEEKS